MTITKRISIIVIVLALLASIIMPSAAFAANTTVTGTMDVGAPTQLVFTSVPGTPVAGTAFSVTIESQDAAGEPSNLASDTTVTLSNASGGGTLGGILTGTIPNGSSSVTISNITYTKADTLTLNASATGLTSASSDISFSAGAVSASTSTVIASPISVPADGSSASTITVTLMDANSNPVSGKVVTLAQALTGGGSSNSAISAASGSSDASGKVIFTATDTTEESVTYTATDTTDASLVIGDTAAVSFQAASLSVNAPGAVSLNLVNDPSTAQQIVGYNTGTGKVTASNLGTYTYSITVTGNPISLTGSSQSLENPMEIATGDSSNTNAQLIGTGSSWSDVTGVSSGAYNATDAGYFVALDGSSQQIGKDLSAPTTSLDLYVYQKINQSEAHIAGSYTLTLTYSASVQVP